jgi:spermidine/putrescine transport system substrate-binding protein
MKTKFLIPILLVIIALVVFFVIKYNSNDDAPQELRVLAWVGYEEEDLIKPFEKEFNIEVKTETFVGGDKMFAKITQNPDAYDIVVIDPEYIEKLHNAKLLSELNKEDFQFDGYLDKFKDFELCSIEGKFYAVLIRYGVNALVYNTEKLSKEDVSSYSILWNEKVKGKVGIWDWYLPNMGVYSIANGYNSNNPYVLTPNQLKDLGRKMDSLKQNVSGVMGGFSDINQAFVRGDIWVAPALGEHTAAVLAADGHPIDWSIPKEGAVMWIETLGIPPTAKNRKGAINYIKYMQRPEVQAKLTWRNAYRSNIPSIDGINLLESYKQNILKVHNAKEGNKLVNSLYVRLLPTDTIGSLVEKEWQEVWQDFKSK